MLRDTVSGAELSGFTVVAMFIVIAVLTGVLLYLFVLGKKTYFTSTSELPLDDGKRRSDPPGTGVSREAEGRR